MFIVRQGVVWVPCPGTACFWTRVFLAQGQLEHFRVRPFAWAVGQVPTLGRGTEAGPVRCRPGASLGVSTELSEVVEQSPVTDHWAFTGSVPCNHE